MTDELQAQAIAYQRQMAQLLGNPLDSLNKLGAYAHSVAQDPRFYSKERKARDYAAQVRARKPQMWVTRKP